MYIRKDIADQMWNFVSEEKLTQVPTGDIYNEITTIISPDQFIGGDGILNQPRGIDIAPDGTIYVADSKDNQIKQFTTGGTLLNNWGAFGSLTDESALGGTFYEPWDVAVAPDGSVYVADTWNHRIQKFTSDGIFITMWGYFAQGDSSQGYWGPRSLTIDTDGNVYFSDTGNKRIVVFDKDGNFLAQFGGSGTSYGQFNEPVGIALDENNQLYIADTWNHRVQVLVPDLELNTSTTLMSWDVDGWFGESTDNKPYIAVSAQGNIFVSDPEGSLILEYSSAGELLHVWDLRGVVDDEIVMPVDIEFSTDGTMWVSDATNNMIYGYTLPAN
jgi:DNA-binding beta-propeller fold protein YncE